LHAAEVPLYGLTNWSAETYPHVEGKYDFLRRFRHVVVSGRLGMVKPDPRIFAHMLEHVEQPAERCVFIDDNVHNTDAANALGFHGIAHRNAAETAAHLRRLGVAF
jgi:2-haloacid dehalogenase